MDVMEHTSVQDFFQGLSNNNILCGSGLNDGGDDNRDSLLDLLTQSFPDMLTQSYGHLSSLPLDAPDLNLIIQEDDDYQESDCADDSILQEFVCEVQNILSDTKRSNVENAPDLSESLSITPLLPTPEENFSPVKKLCPDPDHLDLLMGPLMDGDDDDFKPQEEGYNNAHLSKSTETCSVMQYTFNELEPLVNSGEIPTVENTSSGEPVFSWNQGTKASSVEKPAVTCVKPIVKIGTCCKPLPSVKGNKVSGLNPVVATVKPMLKVVRAEEESSDEVDIETVDDDELKGRSCAEVLSAKLADLECQAARVRVILPKPQVAPKLCAVTPPTPGQIEKCHKSSVSDTSLPAKSQPSSLASFPHIIKPSPKAKEKEPSPTLLVEKIKQSVMAPRSSILIPHQGAPQSRGKAVKLESIKSSKSSLDEPSSASQSPYSVGTLDHDYCNLPEPVNMLSPTAESPEPRHDDLSTSKVTESHTSCDSELLESNKEPEVPVAKSERKLPLSYRKWNRSRSPSPYSETSCKKRGSRRRSSCSPSSVSSQSIYRSRSRSSSHGRKGRSQTHHRRKHSRGRRSRPQHKRSHYNYSRSSSQSSYSSRSRSRSISRSRSRSRSRSWDYKRAYNRAPVSSYSWGPDKRHNLFDEKNQQIEERRVVYVGRLPDGTTKNDLRHRFGCFGPIQEVSVHFRDSGHNYGFVTFSYKSDAYEAVEHGNDDPSQPKFDLSFGGRRQFCKQRYADLDSQYNNYSIQRPSPTNDFDSLLRAAKMKLKKY